MPITSAREVVVCAADFQATHNPFGARRRGYLRNLAVSDGTFSPCRLPCDKSISCHPQRPYFHRAFASMVNAKKRGSRGMVRRGGGGAGGRPAARAGNLH